MTLPRFFGRITCRLVSLTCHRIFAFSALLVLEPGELVSFYCSVNFPLLFEVVFGQNPFVILVIFQVENDLLNFIFLPSRSTPIRAFSLRLGLGVFFTHFRSVHRALCYFGRYCLAAVCDSMCVLSGVFSTLFRHCSYFIWESLL